MAPALNGAGSKMVMVTTGEDSARRGEEASKDKAFGGVVLSSMDSGETLMHTDYSLTVTIRIGHRAHIIETP